VAEPAQIDRVGTRQPAAVIEVVEAPDDLVLFGGEERLLALDEIAAGLY
jgi:hypothetical protein